MSLIQPHESHKRTLINSIRGSSIRNPQFDDLWIFCIERMYVQGTMVVITFFIKNCQVYERQLFAVIVLRET